MRKCILFFLCLVLFATTQAQLSAEQKTIRKVFFDFLSFYQKNEKKFNSFQLYKGIGKENNPPFKMQWKEADRYFAYLRSSVPYVGEAYINAEKAHFKYADSCFKADPQEEIAAGFDYDRWAGGQESIQYTKNGTALQKNKYIVTIIGNKAELKIGCELWEGAEVKTAAGTLFLCKRKGKWKMADNIYPAEAAN